MSSSPDDLARMAGLELFDYQRAYLESVQKKQLQRTCLYYRTGAGKSFTALAGMKLLDYHDVMVIAPPSTHKQWDELAQKLGMVVVCMSHAKFRMASTQLSRFHPVIADEFHLFGGHKGQGWRKLDILGKRLQAPLVLMSATPNYNDVERVYCVQHILAPHLIKGGYLQFLYEHCLTEQNPFGMEPKVVGFRNHPDAAAFLASLPSVFYLPDERKIDIIDVLYFPNLPDELESHGYNRRKHRVVASLIEMSHTQRLLGLIDRHGWIQPEVMDTILKMLPEDESILIYANHSTVALALSNTLVDMGFEPRLVTGDTSKVLKEQTIQAFNRGEFKILIGTASLATGTDGMDKICNTLLIVDDTDDDALRQQLIGRILPRGESASLVGKKIFRLIPA